MKRPSDSETAIEMTPLSTMPVRSSDEKSACAHRTSPNDTTAASVPTVAHRAGSMAHSWGNRMK